ncbi:tyrosine-type recombinase/integrase [Sphingopyxis flava]|uniref:Phage integrase family protein n=1 Tax=Sphingopyxis flava TaxID=1507287 RepID=A0A1T4ZVP8_9SPHN|nr:integrase arm-type DNA-binding domain-containing protein [Sphingopyxis flava]SKB26812.1 Phage integrase family protein [Sphingopyxis flava]
MLNDAKIKAAKPKAAAYKLADSEQLYLFVSPAGGKHWRMNYTYGRNLKGKPAQKTLALGSYPAVTLLDARAKRDAAKAMLREGRDPAVERRVAAKAKALSNANTFEAVALQWFELKSGWSVEKFKAWRDAHDGGWSPRDSRHWVERPRAGWSVVHAGDVFRSLERDVFPEIGDLPITEIESPRVLEVLNIIVQRGAIETAHRVCQRISDVYIYAIPAGIAKRNPAASMAKALPRVPPAKKQAAIIDRIEKNEDRLRAVRQLLIDCEALRTRAGTKFALRLLALTAVRPGELRGARWEEFEGLDGPEPLWRIPAARMKGDAERKLEEAGDHLVPLARQSVEVLQALRQLSGHLPLLFPSERHAHRPISENTLRALLIRAGYEQRHVPHGFRATMSTIMNEAPGRQKNDRAIIDLMLAHVPKDKVEGAYNRAAYMGRRRELAQEWADMLLEGMWDPHVHLGQPIRNADKSPKGPRAKAAA